MVNHVVTIEKPVPETTHVPAALFGQNLEHTRSCIVGGLSAQLLRNRKFCGKPSRDGIAAEWQSFGQDVYFELPQNDSYTRHDDTGCKNMPRRNERSRQFLMHVNADAFAGIAQQAIPLMAKKYLFRIALLDRTRSCGTIRIEFRNGSELLAGFETELASAEWEVKEFSFVSPGNVDAELRIGLTGQGSLSIGMVSLLPEDSWRGMRTDVIEHLREIGTSLIRWPGGNFAGEYRWRDGLLPADERAPLESAMDIETQPYTNGFDYNEICADDIVALCRRIGAEPYFTINAVWDTPEGSAAWVEYCNGSADTPMGRIRAERGFPEPFNVKFWSLGNEMGYAHMEGVKTAADYAAMVSAHGRAMKQIAPGITLCSSGPYPNEKWEKEAATPLAPLAPVVSYHRYMPSNWDFTSPERLEARFKEVLPSITVAEKALEQISRNIPENMTISYDEWNLWYVWYRLTSPLDGIWAGCFLHWLLQSFRKYRIGCCCYFQPINENAIITGPRESRLSPIGQAMQLISGHKYGEILPFSTPDTFATRHEDGSTYVTILNTDFHKSLTKKLPCTKGHAEIIRLLSKFLLPGKEFTIETSTTENLAEITVEPLSIVSVKFRP